MITENMIEAGIESLSETYALSSERMVTAIYEAMTKQKQKDAMIAYKDSVDDNIARLNKIHNPKLCTCPE